MRMKNFFVAAICLLAFVLTACGGSQSEKKTVKIWTRAKTTKTNTT